MHKKITPQKIRFKTKTNSLPLLFSLCWLGERCEGHPTSTSLLISESCETSGYKLIFFLFSEDVMSAEELFSLLWCGPNRLSISNLLPLLGTSEWLPWSEAEVMRGLRRPPCWEFSRASSTELPAASESLFPAMGLCRPLSIRIISFLILSIIKPREEKKKKKKAHTCPDAPMSCD